MATRAATSRTIKPTATELIAPRSLFVKVTPVPTTFAERRAALHAIKKHARIEAFKKLPVSLDEAGQHNPASFVSIAETEEAAKKLVEVSPLTYEVAKPIPTTPITPRPTVMPATPDHVIERHTRAGIPLPKPAPAPSDEDRRQFVVHIFSSPEYNHLGYISRSRFYGPWRVDRHRKQSIIDTLMKSIPVNIRQEGLATWDGLDLELEEPTDLSVKDIWQAREKERNDVHELPELSQGLWKFQKKVLAEKQRMMTDRLPGMSLDDLQMAREAVEAEMASRGKQPEDGWLDGHDKPTPENSKVKQRIGPNGQVLEPNQTVELARKLALKAEQKKTQTGSFIQPLESSEVDSPVTKVHQETPRAAIESATPDAATETQPSPTFENSIFLAKVMEETLRREATEKLEKASEQEQLEAVERSKEDKEQ